MNGSRSQSRNGLGFVQEFLIDLQRDKYIQVILKCSHIEEIVDLTLKSTLGRSTT